MGSVPRERWPGQRASRDATLVAHGIPESLPYTALVTHLRHELGMGTFPVLQLPAHPLSPVPPRAGAGGTREGPLVGFAQGLQEAEGGNSDTEPDRAEGTRERP